MGTNIDLNAAGLVSLALKPEWVDQSTYTGAPETAEDGVWLNGGLGSATGTPKADFLVALRDEVHRRKALITVDTRDATANYTATVNGTAIATTSGAFATDDTILVELQAKITADATVGDAAGANQVVTSVLLDSDGDETVGTAGGGNAAVSLQVQGTVNEDYSIAVSAGGTGVLACEADAASCDIQVWVYPGGIIQTGSTGYAGWVKPIAALFEDIDYGGATERLDVAGYARMYVELLNIDGHASDGASVTYSVAAVLVGPCVLAATV